MAVGRVCVLAFGSTSRVEGHMVNWGIRYWYRLTSPPSPSGRARLLMQTAAHRAEKSQFRNYCRFFETLSNFADDTRAKKSQSETFTETTLTTILFLSRWTLNVMSSEKTMKVMAQLLCSADLCGGWSVSFSRSPTFGAENQNYAMCAKTLLWHFVHAISFVSLSHRTRP